VEAVQTERLILRAFELSDIEAAHREFYAKSDVWGPKPRQYVEDTVTMAMLMARSPDDQPWAKRAVVLRETGQLIGQVRLGPSPNSFYRWAEEPEPGFNKPEVELSFAFGKQFWGQGYAFEASREMIRYAFEDLGLHRLVNGTGNDNVRSIALHKRLGFEIFPALPDGDGIVAVLNNPGLVPVASLGV